MEFITDISGIEPEKDDLYCLAGYAYLPLATEEECDMWATSNLTNKQWELEYQGLYLADKKRYIQNHSRYNPVSI